VIAAALLLALVQGVPLDDGDDGNDEEPFLRPGDTIALVGGGLAEQLGRSGHLEAALHERLPGHRLRVRTLAWPGDTVSLRPRPLSFGSLQEHLERVGASVVLLFFGGVESFDGGAGLEAFERDLTLLARDLGGRTFDGVATPRIALVSPIAHENLGPPLPDPTQHNEDLRRYSAAVERVADELDVRFIDLFTGTFAWFYPDRLAPRDWDIGERTTRNGIQLSPTGCENLSRQLAGLLAPVDLYWSLDVRAGDQGGDVQGARLVEVEATASALRARLESDHARGLVESLRVRGLEPGRYRIVRDEVELGVHSHRELSEGVDLSAKPSEAERRFAPFRAELLALAVEKEQRFFHRYRAVNGEYVYGRRKEPFGVVNFPDEMRRWDELVRESERAMHELVERARERTLRVERVP
jgi:hypothetical protein